MVFLVAGFNPSMLQRLLSHKVISPADWEVAGTSSILPQNSTLSKAAVAHELQAFIQHGGHPSSPTDIHKSEHSSGKGGNCMQMSELNCNLAMKNTIILLIKPNQFYLKEKGCFSYLKYPLIHCYQ